MNGNCNSCDRETLCAYEYKPTDCCDYRKFRPAPNVETCPNCLNTFFISCKECNNTGLIVKDKLK